MGYPTQAAADRARAADRRGFPVYHCACAEAEGNDWCGPEYCKKGKCEAASEVVKRAPDVPAGAVEDARAESERRARLPTDATARKASPMVSGLLDYFPDALADVARLSKIGNDQHNPGEPIHWARGKSTDEADCILRHLADRGTLDVDRVRHSTKVAWRALANLQKEIERDERLPISRGSKE